MKTTVLLVIRRKSDYGILCGRIPLYDKYFVPYEEIRDTQKSWDEINDLVFKNRVGCDLSELTIIRQGYLEWGSDYSKVHATLIDIELESEDWIPSPHLHATWSWHKPIELSRQTEPTFDAVLRVMSVSSLIRSAVSFSVPRRAKEKAKKEFIEAMEQFDPSQEENSIPSKEDSLDKEEPKTFIDSIARKIKVIKRRHAVSFLAQQEKTMSDAYKEFKSHSHTYEREIEICISWLHIKKNWREEWYRDSIRSWDLFMEFQNDETRKKEKCSGCGEMCIVDGICKSMNVCNICDDRVQPYIANPKNRYLVRLFLDSYVDDLLVMHI